MVKREYFIFVNGDQVFVSKEVYQAYWQQTNRENYLERLDRKNKLLFFSEAVETIESIENLYEALAD